MGTRTAPRTAIAALLAASFVWTSPAFCESVFNTQGEAASAATGVPSFSMNGASPVAAAGMASLWTVAPQDSLEIFEVELEEERDGKRLFKEIAMVAIVAGTVGYMLYMMIDPGGDEEVATEEPNGKPVPTARVPFPIIR